MPGIMPNFELSNFPLSQNMQLVQRQRRIKVGVDKELIQQVFREELLQIRKHPLGMTMYPMMVSLDLLTDTESLKSVDEALSIPWANRLLPVSKQVTKGAVHGVSVEQSDIELSGELFCTHAKWRTICFESHSLHEMLQREVKGGKVGMEEYLRAVPGSSVQGYPTFIMKEAHCQ